MEIVRFGPGHRRPDGPQGSHGVADQVLWSDERAHVSELAFARRALLRPEVSPRQALFVVVSGGGWVQVADERAPVHHGEAVTWPAGVRHAAWTDGSEMRAILVELPDDAIMAGHTALDSTGSQGVAPPAPARGKLTPRAGPPNEHDPSEGEPW